MSLILNLLGALAALLLVGVVLLALFVSLVASGDK